MKWDEVISKHGDWSEKNLKKEWEVKKRAKEKSGPWGKYQIYFNWEYG